MREPVHQLADQTGPTHAPIVRTKCGLTINRKYDKTSRYSSWDSEITCTDCDPHKWGDRNKEGM